MTDDELITAVKETVTDVHMNIPAEQIVTRSRAIRVRQRIPRLAGALALVATAALAVTTLLPGSHKPSVHLAAWTVAEQTGGSISVTIHELRNPAGLQRKLRADGVPASVTFVGQQDPSCRPYPAGQALMNRVFPGFPPRQAAPSPVIVIHPSALPTSTGVYLRAAFSQHPPPGGPRIVIGASVGHASPRCTGS